MSKVISSALLLGLISMSTQLAIKHCYGTTPPQNLYPKTSMIQFNIDDIVTKVTIDVDPTNKLNPYMSDDEKGNWLWTHSVPNLTLRPGTLINISGKNQQGAEGMLVTIHFFDKYGNLKYFNSNQNWYCNGKPAVVKGPNKDSIWPYVPCVHPDAQWIWVAPGTSQIGDEVTCSFKIPDNA